MSDPIKAIVEPSAAAVYEPGDLSPETRALMQGVVKESAERDAAEEAADADPPAAAPETGEKPPVDPPKAPVAAAAPDPAPITPKEGDPAPPEGDPPAEPPPADPKRFDSAFSKIRAAEQELEAKRAALKPIEEAQKVIDEAKNGYSADRTAAMRAFIGQAIGSTDPDKVKAEVDSLYEELTLQVLGVPLDSDQKATSDAAKLRREFELYKQKQASEDAKRQTKADTAELAAAAQGAVTTIGNFLETDGKGAYPYLALEDNAAEVVWSVLSGTLEEENREISVKEAAGLAETHFKNHAAKYRTLLTPAQGESPPSKPPPAPAPPPSKGAGQTLTAAKASEAPAHKGPLEYIEDDEESMARSLRMVKAMQTDDE